MSELAALPLSERPTWRAFDVARLLDAYATERARKAGGPVPVSVLTYVEGGELLIEWNIRGRTVRHFECTINGRDADWYSLLFSWESRTGRILRMTEIPRAELSEVLVEIGRFFKPKARRTNE